MSKAQSSLLAGALLCGLGLWMWGSFGVDDAYISFRYAWNWVEGNGLAFNRGEAVEGYTNFLWVLWTALGLWCGQDPMSWSRLLGLACTGASVLLTWKLAEELSLPTAWRAAACLWVMLSSTLLFWATAGLEGPLFMFLWLASRRALRRAWEAPSRIGLLSLWLFLLPLCRPDGVIPVALAFGFWGVWASQRGQLKAWSRSLLGVASGGALYAGWKLYYFGHLLPNTFYAKANPTSHSLGPGLAYAGRFALAHPWCVLALVALVLLWRPAKEAKEPEASQQADRLLLRMLAVESVVFGLYIAAVGGDGMPYFRFFLPLLPGAAILGAWTLWRWQAQPGRWVWLAVWALGLASFAHTLGGSEALKACQAQLIVSNGRLLGLYLHKILPKKATIAVNVAGSIPYFSQRPTVDMLGLNDAHIARKTQAPGGPVIRGHSKGDGAYVLRRRPLVVVFKNACGSKQPFYFSDRDLWRQPPFRKGYGLHTTTHAKIHAQLYPQKPPLKPRKLRMLLTWRSEQKVLYARSTGLLRKSDPAGLLEYQDIWVLSAKVHLYIQKPKGK